MSRSGQNGGGKGGRDYRVNWSERADGGAAFGDYTITLSFAGSASPWLVSFKNEPLRQAHGTFTGYSRFKTIANAKRWVEKRLRTIA